MPDEARGVALGRGLGGGNRLPDCGGGRLAAWVAPGLDAGSVPRREEPSRAFVGPACTRSPPR